MFDYEHVSWAGGYVHPDKHSDYHARQFQWCLGHLTSTTGRVLEVGCGEGKFIRSLKRYSTSRYERMDWTSVSRR